MIVQRNRVNRRRVRRQRRDIMSHCQGEGGREGGRAGGRAGGQLIIISRLTV